MSYGQGRGYIKGNTEYRAVVVTTGQRMQYDFSEKVFTETEEEYQARKLTERYAGERFYGFKELGLEPYVDTEVVGPYGTPGPAYRALGVRGVGRKQGFRKERFDRNHEGVKYVSIGEVQVGEVTWTKIEEESS